jgi:DNA-binding beta-propeller fold protein YncE
MRRLVLAALVLACACADEPPAPAEQRRPLVIERPTATARARLAAVGGRQEGSALALADLAGRRVALVADEDARAVRVVDAESYEELDAVRLDGRPAQVVVGDDGRAYVTVRDANEVAVLEAVGEGLAVASRLPTAAEPFGVAISAGANLLVVTAAWGAQLAFHHLKRPTKPVEIQLPREPRGVALTPDGKHAVVAHAVGSKLSRVSVATGEVEAIDLAGKDGDGGERGALQMYSVTPRGGTVLVPGVMAHRGRESVGNYGTSDALPPHEAALQALEPDGSVRQQVSDDVVGIGETRPPRRRGSDDCLLPRAAAVDHIGAALLVACLDQDRVVAYDVHEAATLEASKRGSIAVPSGPTGLAFDPDARRLHVWSQFSQTLSAVQLSWPHASSPFADAGQPSRIHPLGRLRGTTAPLSAQARLGRLLFHRADPRVSSDGRSCASCHPDGRDDAMTWPTPHGERQTPMLAGRLTGTGPFGWQGDAATLNAHLEQTFERLGGAGLPADDVAALKAYLAELPVPSAPAPDATHVAEGRALFFSEQSGCAGCHAGGGGVDGARHHAGSEEPFETPSLRYVRGTAPYFHDGRYATLGELLRSTEGTMGSVAGLEGRELAALEAYLLTL